ncbi:Gp5.5-like host HNS inhibition [Pectobacterium phage PP74]|uniref:HNS binding protein n=1 Tax=Pectobacterium phage PP74 TaxID=1916101 RepID=A0A1J0MEI5_9CAUD|nr:Gp5.5-like host HNS inhibition [Pectobacterium phage PP74]APD19637.1 hypothetical protein PP74_25 [Pectobacterium phage PP74]
MGMNKQFRVAFDVTATLSNEQEEALNAALVELAKMDKRTPRQDNLLVQALTHGPEGAMVAIMKDELRTALRELCQEISCDVVNIKFSPATVREKF